MQLRLYVQYLFSKFTLTFKSFLCIPNQESKNKHSYYTINDQPYARFLVFFLQQLEPLRINKKEILFQEFDTVDMIIFIQQAGIDFGYDINR